MNYQLYQMIFIYQKNTGTFLCNIHHTLRKAAFGQNSILELLLQRSSILKKLQIFLLSGELGINLTTAILIETLLFQLMRLV